MLTKHLPKSLRYASLSSHSIQYRHFSAIGPPKNILYINSLGTEVEDKQIYKELNELVPQFTTNVKYDVCSFKLSDKPINPNKQEWDWYYNHEIIKTIRWAKYYKYSGIVIGDTSITPMAILLNTHNVNDFTDIKITSLGEASCIVAKGQSKTKTFSIIIGYKHLIPLFKENLIKYGFEEAFKSFHVLYDGELDINNKKEYYWDRQSIAKLTQKAIQTDKCGAIILSSVCDLETCGMIQTKFPKIPIIYPEMAALKYCEMLIDDHRNQGIQKKQDNDDYNDVLFDKCPVGHIIGNTNIDNKHNLKSTKQ